MKPIQQVWGDANGGLGISPKPARSTSTTNTPTLNVQMNWPRIIERVLKLALPNLYAWLCMFYCLFHLWLNILAELLR